MDGIFGVLGRIGLGGCYVCMSCRAASRVGLLLFVCLFGAVLFVVCPSNHRFRFFFLDCGV